MPGKTEILESHRKYTTGYITLMGTSKPPLHIYSSILLNKGVTLALTGGHNSRQNSCTQVIH
jgi:hypothetical protein